jgi:hypothetical protein
MSNVRIVPGKKGTVVTAYDSNADFGYVQLEQSAIVMTAGWVREVKRTCLLRGKTATLEQFVSSCKGLAVPGKLVALEFLESQVPADVAKEFLRDDVSYEEAIDSYIKRAGADGPALTSNGERILRFVKWDTADQLFDVNVIHDNQAEVSASKSLESGKGMLPGGE